MRFKMELIERLNDKELSEFAKKQIVQEFRNAGEELYRVEGLRGGTVYTTVKRNTKTLAITTMGHTISKAYGSVRYFNRLVHAVKVS